MSLNRNRQDQVWNEREAADLLLRKRQTASASGVTGTRQWRSRDPARHNPFLTSHVGPNVPQMVDRIRGICHTNTWTLPSCSKAIVMMITRMMMNFVNNKTSWDKDDRNSICSYLEERRKKKMVLTLGCSSIFSLAQVTTLRLRLNFPLRVRLRHLHSLQATPANTPALAHL